MKLARTVLFAVSLLILVAGYIASQVAYFGGIDAFRDYGAKVDSAPVRVSALLLLSMCIAIPFLDHKSEDLGS